jgi:enoyl-CoA hydratase/carnithine racemase
MEIAMTSAFPQHDYATIAVDRPLERVLRATLDRPDAANAMNTRMGLDLVHLFESFALDAQDVRCIVVTGRGDKVFCAGADLKEAGAARDLRARDPRHHRLSRPDHRRRQRRRLCRRLRDRRGVRLHLRRRPCPLRPD